jgi:hypothetical protein
MLWRKPRFRQAEFAVLVFFRVQPSRVTARLIVGPEIRTPKSAAYQAQCSANVASGATASRVGSTSRNLAVLIGGRPRRGRGASAPVSRRKATYRFTVARPTSKTRAASLRVIPPSTAAMIRDRKSSE